MVEQPPHPQGLNVSQRVCGRRQKSRAATTGHLVGIATWQVIAGTGHVYRTPVTPPKYMRTYTSMVRKR